VVRAAINVVVALTVVVLTVVIAWFWVETVQTFCFPPVLVVNTRIVTTQRVSAQLTRMEGARGILPETAVVFNATPAPRTKSVFAIFTPPAVRDSPLLVQSMAALLIRTRF
jgi:hypothetical protein